MTDSDRKFDFNIQKWVYHKGYDDSREENSPLAIQLSVSSWDTSGESDRRQQSFLHSKWALFVNRRLLPAYNPKARYLPIPQKQCFHKCCIFRALRVSRRLYNGFNGRCRLVIGLHFWTTHATVFLLFIPNPIYLSTMASCNKRYRGCSKTAKHCSQFGRLRLHNFCQITQRPPRNSNHRFLLFELFHSCLRHTVITLFSPTAAESGICKDVASIEKGVGGR